jgi:hypothetical protein
MRVYLDFKRAAAYILEAIFIYLTRTLVDSVEIFYIIAPDLTLHDIPRHWGVFGLMIVQPMDAPSFFYYDMKLTNMKNAILNFIDRLTYELEVFFDFFSFEVLQSLYTLVDNVTSFFSAT